MRFNKVFFVSLLVLCTLCPISLVVGATTIENESVVITIAIQNAYYFDADGDGKENDVAVDFLLDIHRKNGKKNTVHFDLYAELILPSGISYLYLFKVTSSAHVQAQPTAYFYNHATEPGWYCIELTGVLYRGTPQYSIGTESYYFDPPGGTTGTDPLTCKILV